MLPIKDITPQSHRSLLFGMLCIVIFSLLSTIEVWRHTNDYLQKKNNSYFLSIVQQNETAFLSRLKSYAKVLISARAFFDQTDTITREKWEKYASEIDLDKWYPGINGIGYIRPVEKKDLAAFIANERKTFPSFDIHPLVENGPYFVITYIEPHAINLPAIGLNIAFEQNRLQAALRARETGEVAITNGIPLVQDKNSKGFLILVPLYRGGDIPSTPAERLKKFEGWVYAPLIGDKFIASTDLLENPFLELQVYGGKTTDPKSLILSTHVNEQAKHTHQYTHTKTISFLQQDWTFVWSSTKKFDNDLDSIEPDIILFSGITVTLLCGILFITLARRDMIVRRLVDLKTREIHLSQQRLHESEEVFRLAMENSPSGMALLHPDGRWKKVNSRICQILGYSEAELLTMDFVAVTHADDLEKDVQLATKVLNGEITSYEMQKRYIHKAGHPVWVLLGVALIRNEDGSPKYFISQVQDITESKQLEQIKDDFITIIGHELKTPITSIDLSLSLLKENIAKNPEDAVTLIALARRNSRRLIALVNDILDMRKLSSGKMAYDMKPHRISDILQQAVIENAVYSQQYGTTLQLKIDSALEDALIRVDADRLLQILSNFISNAAKFSHQGSDVIIRADAFDQNIRLSVIDSGIGIPEQHKDRIFQKFVQAISPANKKIEGTGLGLYIAHEMTHEMGGDIGFTSEEGAGSTFWCSFPLYSA